MQTYQFIPTGPIPWPLMVVAGILSAMLLVIEHYAILSHWKAWFRQDMPVLVRYVLGVAAVLLPYSWLLLCWGYSDALAAVWCITAIGGAAVGLCYGADRFAAALSLWRDKKRNEHQAN